MVPVVNVELPLSTDEIMPFPQLGSRSLKILRTERLLDRKQELRRLLARSSAISPLKYTEYIAGCGMALFDRVCELDLEGIVAKQKSL